MEWDGLKPWYMVLCVRVRGVRLTVSLVCGALCESAWSETVSLVCGALCESAWSETDCELGVWCFV